MLSDRLGNTPSHGNGKSDEILDCASAFFCVEMS